MNLDKYDTIKIKEADLVKLFAWRDNNKHLVRNFNPSLLEGVIEFEKHFKQYFKDKGFKVEFKVFIHGVLTIHMHYNKLFKTVTMEYFNPKLSFPEEEARQDTLTLHASLMAYMEHYRNDVTRVKRNLVSNNIPKKKKSKGKNNKKKSVKIGRHYIYNVSITKEQSEENAGKRERRKPTGSWVVRGHWRTYKNGKKIWIKSYPKGEGKKILKTYKI